MKSFNLDQNVAEKLTSHLDAKMRQGKFEWTITSLPESAVVSHKETDSGVIILHYATTSVFQEDFLEFNIDQHRVKILSDLLGACDLGSDPLSCHICRLRDVQVRCEGRTTRQINKTICCVKCFRTSHIHCLKTRPNTVEKITFICPDRNS